MQTRAPLPTTIALTSALLLSLVACSSGGTTNTTEPSGALATTATTATAAASAPSGLTFGGWGPLTLGITINEVSSAGFTLGIDSLGDGCHDYDVTAPDGTTLSLGFTPQTGTLSRIRTTGGTAALPDPTPTTAQVRAAYPDATVTFQPPRDPSAGRLTVEDASSQYPIIYGATSDADDATVERPETGPTMANSSTLGCPQP